MIAVLFEVYPKPGCEAAYLDLAAALRPLVEKVDGFISVERFRSVNPEGKILSLLFWRDEHAVVKWREVYEHKIAQRKGAFELFESYRIRLFHADRSATPRDRSDLRIPGPAHRLSGPPSPPPGVSIRSGFR
jgi:heme-degrading monooxygenase HmoA